MAIMKARIGLCGLLVLLIGVCTTSAQDAAHSSCVATTSNLAGGFFGDDRLSVYVWPSGEIVFQPNGSGFVTKDGALGMKFGWQRGVHGRLTIEGRRLDATAPPLRSEVNNGYGDIGFQASYVIFPTPGCWEVTGRAGDAAITFITRVTLIGDGPSWRRGR